MLSRRSYKLLIFIVVAWFFLMLHSFLVVVPFDAPESEEEATKEVPLSAERLAELKEKAVAHREFVKKYGAEVTGWKLDTKCLLTKQEKEEPIIIYGVGAGEDIGWDMAMVKEYGAEVFVFDPTDKSNRYVTPIVHGNTLEGKLHYYPEGMSDKEGLMTLAMPVNPDHVSMREVNLANEQMKENLVTAKVNTLKNWMKKLGHKHLDILKIDIEGAEYGVLEALLKEKFLPFTQLLVEYHDRFLPEAERSRHTKLKEDLEAAGFFELWYENHEGQEAGYLKLADLETCE